MTPILSTRKVFTICLIALPAIFYGQANDTISSGRTRNIVWFTPSGASKINGLAVGFQAVNLEDDTLMINGVNASFGIVSVFMLPYALSTGLFAAQNRKTEFYPDQDDTARILIRGLNISLGGEMGIEMQGVNFAGGITIATKIYGFSLTGIYTRCYEFRGIMLSGLNNIAMKGHGLQIGLVNYCKNLKGIQIGLWNKSGKRSLPFINWGS